MRKVFRLQFAEDAAHPIFYFQKTRLNPARFFGDYHAHARRNPPARIVRTAANASAAAAQFDEKNIYP